MKAYQLQAYNSLDALKLIDLPTPTIKEHEVLVNIKANSLNFRELLILRGGYARNKKIPVIPCSDGAGEVVAVGSSVTEFKVGDRVAANFFRDWVSGQATEAQMATAFGGAIDGMLVEYVALPEHCLVKLPDHLSYEEGATLPCAALTAWNSLTTGNLTSGQTLLTLGTGGVSVFAFQLAKAMGARVIITSGSDDKLQQAKDLGADEVINYRQYPEWQNEVLEITNGKGVDQVVEVGGAGTLERSLAATKLGGYIGIIGVLTGLGEGGFTPATAFFNQLRLQGIYVGSRTMFETMATAIDLHKIKPVIHEIVDFREARKAYELLESAQHFGKVVISHN